MIYNVVTENHNVVVRNFYAFKAENEEELKKKIENLEYDEHFSQDVEDEGKVVNYKIIDTEEEE